MRGIGGADHRDGVKSLEYAGAWIGGKSAGFHDVVGGKAADDALLIAGDRRADLMPSGMVVARERFEAVTDEFNRPAKQHGGGANRHLVVIGMKLDTETAAHVGYQNTHAVFTQAKLRRKDGAHLVGNLRRCVDGQGFLCRVEFSQDRATLKRNAGVARETQLTAYHMVSLVKGRLRVCAADPVLEEQIGPQFGVQHCRALGERVGGARERRIAFPLDLDQGDRVLGDTTMDVNGEVWKFFDRFLKSKPEAFPSTTPKIRYYSMGDNQWKTSPQWPPKEAQETRLYGAWEEWRGMKVSNTHFVPRLRAAQARRHHAKANDHLPLSQSCLFAC